MKIYVGNLSSEVTNEDLKGLFTAYGQVESAEVVKDKYSGNPRGFGFVSMPTKQEAIAAITALQGQDLKGQALEVNEARPPADRKSGGGRPSDRGRRPDRGRGPREDKGDRGGGRF